MQLKDESFRVIISSKLIKTHITTQTAINQEGVNENEAVKEVFNYL